jgi:hypothetical protein
MSENIDISGLDKADVLAALHNGTKCLGMGVLHDIGTCSVEQARKDIKELKDGGRELHFDYYHGRPLKVDISGDSFNPRCYDRDSPWGEGAAKAAIDGLRGYL